jgi:hypothetical protein
MNLLSNLRHRLGLPVEIAITALVLLLLTGTVVYHYLESWSWVDSFYFTACTLTTVGYGDLYPTTEISKAFTAVFALSGVSIALASFTIIGTSYLRKREEQLTKLIQINGKS